MRFLAILLSLTLIDVSACINLSGEENLSHDSALNNVGIVDTGHDTQPEDEHSEAETNLPNKLPVAVAEARVPSRCLNSYMPYPNLQDALPIVVLDVVELTGSNSYAPNGEIATYQWSVCSRPDGSAAHFVPDSEQVFVTFHTDIPGTYCFKLEVWDNHGIPSADSSHVYVRTVSNALQVQLLWIKPDSTGTLDQSGTDLDIHLLHPMGHDWFDNHWDLYWGNPQPSWNELFPSLDIDDLLGPGPENIFLYNPTHDINFRIGVHYYESNGKGPIDAIVRVFLRDNLLYTNRRLLSPSAFWEIASFTNRCEDSIVEIDRIITEQDWLIPEK